MFRQKFLSPAIQVLTEKKRLSDDAENNTAIASTSSQQIEVVECGLKSAGGALNRLLLLRTRPNNDARLLSPYTRVVNQAGDDEFHAARGLLRHNQLTPVRRVLTTFLTCH